LLFSIRMDKNTPLMLEI